ncbi:hypothetical protein BpHYR1_027146 [Brachionus plicatilis]|uniref:Uncharacterized protein n=1 Tax=Brachionus plicatilis TaxID=10195 RepID=A0A3M7QGG8_BRAPC|nr:hypothetical protein BpHYR1_027146 [Brachionus plicatilis]
MLVFLVKNTKIGFVEIVCQRVLNKIIHFIVQTTMTFFTLIVQFLILYSCGHVALVEKGQNEDQCSIHSDMSLKSSNYVIIVFSFDVKINLLLNTNTFEKTKIDLNFFFLFKSGISSICPVVSLNRPVSIRLACVPTCIASFALSVHQILDCVACQWSDQTNKQGIYRHQGIGQMQSLVKPVVVISARVGLVADKRLSEPGAKSVFGPRVFAGRFGGPVCSEKGKRVSRQFALNSLI